MYSNKRLLHTSYYDNYEWSFSSQRRWFGKFIHGILTSLSIIIVLTCPLWCDLEMRKTLWYLYFHSYFLLCWRTSKNSLGLKLNLRCCILFQLNIIANCMFCICFVHKSLNLYEHDMFRSIIKLIIQDLTNIMIYAMKYSTF